MTELIGPELPWGRVVHRALGVTADAGDEGLSPDILSLADLTVTLTPSVRFVVWTGEGGPVTHIPLPVTGHYGSDGRLYFNGSEAIEDDGISILATSHADMQPSGWHWKVEWSGNALASCKFTLAPGAEVDLSYVVLTAAVPG